MKYARLEKKETLFETLQSIAQLSNVSTLYDFLDILRPKTILDEGFEYKDKKLEFSIFIRPTYYHPVILLNNIFLLFIRYFLRSTVICTESSCKNYVPINSSSEGFKNEDFACYHHLQYEAYIIIIDILIENAT